MDLQKLGPFGGAAVLTAIEVVADTAAKLGDNDSRFFDGYNSAVLYGGYLANAFVLQNVLARNSIAITNAYWNAMTNVTHVLIGTLAFGEVLTQREYVAIGLITAGIVLLAE